MGILSTREYLTTLDLDQLVFAKEELERLLKKKREEDWTPLWVVSDEDINYAAFTEDQYDLAVQALVTVIQKEAERSKGDLRFELLKIRYRQSEVADMLALRL